MNKLTVLVDMDDTLEDLLPAWVARLNERHGLNVDPNKIQEWDMTVAFPELSPEDIFSVLEEDEFWDTVRPKDSAVAVLKQIIDDGHDVFVVTSSSYKTIEAKTERVLFRYFQYLSWDQVIVTANKQMIRGDIIIDDAPHNIVGGGLRKRILMDAPHNRDFQESSCGAVRVHNWIEAYREVCKYAERG